MTILNSVKAGEKSRFVPPLHSERVSAKIIEFATMALEMLKEGE